MSEHGWIETFFTPFRQWSWRRAWRDDDIRNSKHHKGGDWFLLSEGSSFAELQSGSSDGFSTIGFPLTVLARILQRAGYIVLAPGDTSPVAELEREVVDWGVSEAGVLDAAEAVHCDPAVREWAGRSKP